MTMKSQLIKVNIKYPSAHEPFKHEYPPATPVSTPKADALTAFGLREETLPDGSQVLFFLFHGNTKIQDLTQLLSTFAPNTNATVEFRLAREIIAG
jgi:hypothetical protein